MIIEWYTDNKWVYHSPWLLIKITKKRRDRRGKSTVLRGRGKGTKKRIRRLGRRTRDIGYAQEYSPYCLVNTTFSAWSTRSPVPLAVRYTRKLSVKDRLQVAILPGARSPVVTLRLAPDELR